MEKVDLHVHSTYSDGTLTPKELVIRAKEFGLSAMALTDHDTLNGIPDLIEAGKKHDLEVVPGVELSTFFDNKEIHIVGLYINPENQQFQQDLLHLQNIREHRNEIMCEKFAEIGISISYEEMLEKYKDSVITRAHFADFLLEKGFIKSRNEAFERYIGPNGPCYVPRQKLDPADAIRMIKNAGGVPILAHPVLYHLGKEQLHKLMDYLKNSGIVGMETVYSTYTMGDEIQMRNLAHEYDLIESGGSDYHGANKPYLEIGIGKGHLCVPYQFLSVIKEHRG